MTYVRKRGRLVPLPDGLMMMVPTRILPLLTTRLLGWGTKLRMGMELLRAPKPQRGRRIRGRVHRRALRRRGGGLPGRAAALRHLRRRPGELSVDRVLPRFVELANRYGSLTRGVLAERAKAAQPRTARRRRCSAP